MLREALVIELTLVGLAISVAFINVIPAYTGTHATIVEFLCVLTFAAGIVCVTLAWKVALSRRESAGEPHGALRWVAALGVTLGVVCWLPFALLCYAQAAGPGGIFGRGELVMVTSSGDETLYLYHSGCFPPDNGCECDDYHSLVFRKNHYLPIMHRVASPRFYVDGNHLEVRDGVLILRAESSACAKDVGKTHRVRL